MKNEDNIGSRIQKMRNAVGMSQAELGQRIGRKNRTVSMYEIGTANVPDEVLEMIADVFGVSAEWLRDGDECYTVTKTDEITEEPKTEQTTAKTEQTTAKITDFMSENEKYFADEVQKMHSILFKQIFTAQMKCIILKNLMEKLGLQAEFAEYMKRYSSEV